PRVAAAPPGDMDDQRLQPLLQLTRVCDDSPASPEVEAGDCGRDRRDPDLTVAYPRQSTALPELPGRDDSASGRGLPCGLLSVAQAALRPGDSATDPALSPCRICRLACRRTIRLPVEHRRRHSDDRSCPRCNRRQLCRLCPVITCRAGTTTEIVA